MDHPRKEGLLALVMAFLYLIQEEPKMELLTGKTALHQVALGHQLMGRQEQDRMATDLTETVHLCMSRGP